MDSTLCLFFPSCFASGFAIFHYDIKETSVISVVFGGGNPILVLNLHPALSC